MKKLIKRTAYVLGGLTLIIALASAIAGIASSHSKATPAASPTVTHSAPATPAPATTAPASQAPAAPSVTASQGQALSAAKGYLSDGEGFSRDGLIKQLTSSYGNDFSTADATWAVDRSGADWNAQAVMAAKGYMSDGEGFSRQGLINQLTSPYGNDFSTAQATYAAGKVGL